MRTIVTNTFYGNSATKYGHEMEFKAREQLEIEIEKSIEECGLVIQLEYSFLAASPDGLIGWDHVVEIKCPTILADKNEEEAEEIISNCGIK